MILPQLGRSENMRLPEDFEEQNTGKPVIYMFVGMVIGAKYFDYFVNIAKYK